MGLPPTSSKLSTDTSNVTTFNYQFPNFTGTHTGITMALGTNSVSGGGTGLTTLTANNVILGNGTSAPLFVAPGTSGNLLSSNGTTWLSTTPVGNSAFAIFASNIVNTNSVTNTSGIFATYTNSPAFTFSPTLSGTYKVYASVPISSFTGSLVTTRIFNTSANATLLQESQGLTFAQISSGTFNDYDSVYIESVYTLTAGTSYIFDIQGVITSGTGSQLSGSDAAFYMFAEGVGLAVPSQTSGVAASYYLTPNMSFSAGSPVIPATQIFDTNSAFNTSTGTYTIPTSGFYEISFAGSVSTGSAGIYVQKNGTPLGYVALANSSSPTSGATTISCIAGDTIQLITDTTRTFLGNTTAYLTQFSIVLVPNPSLGGSGVTTMTAFGSSPNANAATISGSNLTLQPASASFPGGVSTTSQTFAGSKTIGFNVADVITIGAASSTALHQTNGGTQLTTRTVTASTFTVDTTTTDRIIYTDSTSNAITITLPAPTNGRILVIQDKTGKAATNNITINPHAAETINGLSTFVIAANYNSCELTSDGTNWLATKLPTSGNSFLTSGTTYTTPVNITPQTRFKFTLIGGGGGAGGINTAADGAAGGGAGAAVIVQATGLSANTGYTIAIGGGGTAGASTPTAGGNGGATTINFLSSTYTAGGGTGANDTATSNGGAGGTATSAAGTGVSAIINMPGGGGGAASGVTTNGSGQGGSGFMGWGGISVIAAGVGNAGTGFGGGGSGGKGAAAAGGAGAGGCIVVEWFN